MPYKYTLQVVLGNEDFYLPLNDKNYLATDESKYYMKGIAVLEEYTNHK